MIRFLGESIYAAKIHEADMDQTSLLDNMVKCNNNTRPKTKECKYKRNTFDSARALYERPELTLDTLRSELFPIKERKKKKIKNINF